MAKLHNYMEDVTAEIYSTMAKHIEGMCKCSKCNLDVLAIALNNLPARYVVTEKGRVYAKIVELELQFKTDVVRELTKAVGVVKTSPQH